MYFLNVSYISLYIRGTLTKRVIVYAVIHIVCIKCPVAAFFDYPIIIGKQYVY